MATLSNTIFSWQFQAAMDQIPRVDRMLRDASLAQFPMTVGVWAIFVLPFVKIK
jgi:hypothetical protein